MNGYPDPGPATVSVKPKSMYRTKTFIIFALTFLAAALATAQEILPILATVIDIPAKWDAWIVALIAIVAIVLRRISDRPARFRNPEVRTVRVETH